MNASDIANLVIAITGLVTAIGGIIIGLKAHKKVNAVTDGSNTSGATGTNA